MKVVEKRKVFILNDQTIYDLTVQINKVLNEDTRSSLINIVCEPYRSFCYKAVMQTTVYEHEYDKSEE